MRTAERSKSGAEGDGKFPATPPVPELGVAAEGVVEKMEEETGV